MENEPKVEWIGPKILIVVRIPETKVIEGESRDEELIATLSSNESFKHFCFICIRQEGINQIEFEYPKNYRAVEDRPVAILSVKGTTDDEFENLMKRM